MGKEMKQLERMVADGRPSSLKRDGIPDGVIQNAIDNANEDRVSRQWKRPRSLTRAARLWESSFGVIDLRELNLISAWTAYQNIMECLPPERIITYAGFKRIIQKIMVPLGHAYSVRHVELSRMDIMSMTPETYTKTTFMVVNNQCLPLYAWYLYGRVGAHKGTGWKRTPHTVEGFMRSITEATPEDIDKVFSVRYDHMWLGKFPRGYYLHTWVWNGRVWDGKGNPRDVTLATVHPSIEGVSYEERFIRERHPVDRNFREDEENEQSEGNE